MFKLPEEIIKGTEDYQAALNELVSGRYAAGRFVGIRVPWGIYSHRGGKVFMARIRIPAGQVTGAQLAAIAHVSATYGNGVSHITTRQDIQIHEVKIADTGKVLEYLKDYNLSSAGGGGNTVRNITACSRSGTCPDEVLYVRGCAVSLTEYLLRQETSHLLPRKLKIAFSGCAKDCSGCLVNDIGFLAEERDGRKGFKVFVAGGMGADSRVGKLLEEFLPEEDLGYGATAVKNLFFKHGDRRNRRHNRLRFLVEEMGLEKFHDLYRLELNALKEAGHIALRKIEPRQIKEAAAEIPEADEAEFKKFLSYSLHPQKQAGLVSVELRIPNGDIPAGKLTEIGGLEKEFPEIEFATSQNQNILVQNVRKDDLYRLFLKIKKVLPDFLYAGTILDIACCKGATTCNLGLCNSPALSAEITKLIKERFIDTPVFRGVNLKINGCPNACGHHPIGAISFHGAVRKVDNRPVPFYALLLGGRKDLEKTRLAEKIGFIPAKSVPLFLTEFLKRINERLNEEDDVSEFLAREGREMARELIAKFSDVPPYHKNKDFYADWGKKEDFSLQGLGPGECGAGVLDLIESDLAEAKICLERAEKNSYLGTEIKKSLLLSARALLVVRGADPKNEEEVFNQFTNVFIQTEITSDRFRDIRDVYRSLSENLGPAELKKRFQYAGDFRKEINRLYHGMDSSFNFPKEKNEERTPSPTLLPQEERAPVLDLKGTACPLNYVKAKLYLEGLKSGEKIEILLDEGEPITNVPRSLEDDGHRILNTEKMGNFYKITVQKR
ncbi:MAG: sulfurtransferase TusA family protein [Candidatus Omnitrophica bacterium]|nr:sulfurtransferase TusA family protein [Candidatus Omnitrophota bacterium]